MRILPGLLLSLSLIGCSNNKSDFDPTLCTEKYVSENWNVVVHHSKEWSPYEFYGNNIGLEYRSLNDLERRSDAEVVISFFNKPMTEDEFYEIFDTSQVMTEEVAKSFGAELKSKKSTNGFREFANRKWKIIERETSGSFEDEEYNSRETNYLWYSSEIKIAIKVRVKGEEIDRFSSETDCILNGLIINSNLADSSLKGHNAYD